MILVEDMYLENGKLEALRNKAENTGNTKLQCYHSVILEYTRQNLYLPEEELKEEIYKKLKLTDAQITTVKNRIHIPVSYNIFDFMIQENEKGLATV